jgi:hypothetical protein
MKTIELKFNQDLPGYTIFEEAKIIIELINAVDSSSILEAGAFTGKLTWSLCKTFPDKQITALDLFDGECYVDRIGGRYHTTTERDERYLNQTNTLDFFKNLQSEHTNLNAIKLDFLNYTAYHDVIIISVDANDADWNKVFDHALSLNPEFIIGRHKWFHRSDVINSLNNYEHTNYDFGIYVLHKKL